MHFMLLEFNEKRQKRNFAENFLLFFLQLTFIEMRREKEAKKKFVKQYVT